MSKVNFFSTMMIRNGKCQMSHLNSTSFSKLDCFQYPILLLNFKTFHILVNQLLFSRLSYRHISNYFHYNQKKHNFLTQKNKQLGRHYANMPIQYLAIFHRCKNDNFQMKNCDIFLIFALKHRLWVLVRTASLRRF